MAMSVESVLAARAAQGFRLVVLAHPGGGVQCRLIGQDGALQRLGPAASQGAPTALLAVQAADAALTAIEAARVEASAAEVVDAYLAPGRLRSVMIDVDGVPTRHWEARDGLGNWGEPQPTPRSAVQAARGRNGVGAPVGPPPVGEQGVEK